MSDSSSRLTLTEFKTQVGCMLKSITHLKSSERSEAFGYLQDCVNNLESEDDTSSLHCNDSPNENECANTSNESKNTEEWTKDTSDYEQSIRSFQNDDLNCPKCKQNFVSREILLEHLKTYPGSPIACKLCSVVLNNNLSYEYHIQLGICKDNNVEKSKKCPFCDKIFNSKIHYSRHVEGHKKNDCKECGTRFTHRKNLALHMIEVHKTRLESDIFRCYIDYNFSLPVISDLCIPKKCQLCSQGFVQRRSLAHHYTLVHANEANVCSVCCKIFQDLQQLEEHSKSHNVKQLVCERCQQTFSRRQQYILHIKTHDRFKCLTCDESFAAKTKLIEHERLGHIIQGLEAQFECTKCNKFFLTKSNLNLHASTHSDEKKFICIPCKVSFKKRSHYNRHLLTSAHMNDHPPSEEILSCEQCGKIFTRRDKLVMHQNNVHKASNKIRQCEFCSYKSNSETNLKKHVLLHTQKQQFICEICGSLFYSKNALKEHNKCLHSDEMNYSCEKCGRMFKLVSSLNKHMLSHSDERTKVCHCGHAYKFTHNLKRHQLIAHGKVQVAKRIQRLYEEDSSTSGHTKKKKKQSKQKQQINHLEDPVLSLINTQTTTAPHETVLLMSDRQDTSQILQVSYHNINFSEKPHLVYAQSLDMTNLQVVETMLHLGEDSLKENQNVMDHSPSHSGLFDRPISEGNFLHPPIEPSLVTSLGEPLNETEETNTKQNLMSSLPDYIPHNFPFLNV